MIRVTVDLVAYGIFEPETIGLLEIGNDASTSPDGIANYDYRFGTQDRRSGEIRFEPWYKLRGHRRDDGIWTLIGLIMDRRRAGDEEWSAHNDRAA